MDKKHMELNDVEDLKIMLTIALLAINQPLCFSPIAIKFIRDNKLQENIELKMLDYKRMYSLETSAFKKNVPLELKALRHCEWIGGAVCE